MREEFAVGAGSDNVSEDRRPQDIRQEDRSMSSTPQPSQTRNVERWTGMPAAVVKSAGRALQILEFFDGVRREVSVSEISRALQYPQSSTLSLLRSLVSMGYLQHDRYTRTYHPTRRVSLLGNWVDPSLVQHGAVLEAAKALAWQTGQTVVMATTNGLHAQYIYIQRPERLQDEGFELTIGALRPISRTAVGRALLSAHSDNYVESLLRRINAERPDGEAPIIVSEFIDSLRAGRKLGFFIGPGGSYGDCGIAGILDRYRQQLAIAVEGPAEELEKRETHIADLLRETSMNYSAGRLAGTA
jgi:DNA-binding IclR family transcriptional regulator